MSSVALALGGVAVSAPAAQAASDRPDTLAAARRAPATAIGAWVGDTLATGRDKDWYRFVVPAGVWSKVVLGGLPADYRLSVYDGAGRRVATSNRSGRRFEEVSRALGAGTWFVLVDSAGAHHARSAYRLRLRTFRTGLAIQSLRATPARHEFVGEVFNNTAQWRGIRWVDVSFVDAKGKVLGRRIDAFTSPRLLAPRETVPFWLGFEQMPAGTVRLQLRLPNLVKPRPAASRLSLKITRTTVVGSGSSALRRYWYAVTNAGPRRTDTVVEAREYDAFGVLNRLGVDQPSVGARATLGGFVDVGNLAPVNVSWATVREWVVVG